MKVRNIVRKAAMLGSGSAMALASVAGALAYDLADYPDQFIVDGAFDGTLVVGERAATADVIGSIDIAASLQAASTVEVDIPGQAGETELESEGYKLETGSDGLELRENIGDVVDTISEYELPGLKSGSITTSEGQTDYYQYLRFKDGNNLQNMTVNYVVDDDENLMEFLVVDNDAPFIEWELQLPEGLESERETDGDLDDLQDKTINILGQDFTVVKAEVENGGGDFEMTLMGGSIADTLLEGETRLYSIDGVDYEVTLVFVSDPNSGTVECKFSVNGELTQALEESETDTLSGGLQIGVRDILVNAREGVVSFFLGADKIEITDPNTNNTDTFDGSIEINNENINDGTLDVQGASTASDKYEITDIKYRLEMDPEDSSEAYVPPGAGVKEFMDRPESLISDSLDIWFAGLADVEVTEVGLKSGGGDDEYEMTFTNIQGQEYRFGLINNEGGTWAYGPDDSNEELIFVEGVNAADYVIGDEDIFIVSNDRGTSDADKSVTNVLQYTDYDSTDFTVEFTELANDDDIKVPISTDGTGSLVIGGHTYEVNVSDRTADEPTLAVDLNADGDFGNDKVTITAWGGLVIDIGASVAINDSVTVNSGTDLTPYVRNGGNLESNGTYTGTQQVNMSAKVLAKNFDTSDSGDEFINWTVSEDNTNTEVDLSFSTAQYRGPLNGGVPGVAGEFQFDNPSDEEDDWEFGMSDWGVLIRLYNPSDADQPNDLYLDVPSQQRLGEVFVTLGAVETSEASGGTYEEVNPIAVGLAVLDRDAPAVGSDNLIVIGGPCANTVAAELLGNPDNCAEGFEPGKAVIQAWDQGDTVAILVAGYESTETQGASRVLAQYEDYGLSGSAVEVVVADLNSITVQAPGSDPEPEPEDDSGDDMGDDMEGDDMEGEGETEE